LKITKKSKGSGYTTWTFRANVNVECGDLKQVEEGSNKGGFKGGRGGGEDARNRERKRKKGGGGRRARERRNELRGMWLREVGHHNP